MNVFNWALRCDVTHVNVRTVGRTCGPVYVHLAFSSRLRTRTMHALPRRPVPKASKKTMTNRLIHSPLKYT